MKTTYLQNIQTATTQAIMNHANKQAVKDLAKGRKSSSKKQPSKWKHVMKLCDYQCRAITGKRGMKALRKEAK